MEFILFYGRIDLIVAMKYNGKIINQDVFMGVVCDFCDNDSIDVSYLKEADMPYREKNYQIAKSDIYSVHIRKYDDIVVFRYFTRTDLYTNKVKSGVSVSSSFIREVERLAIYNGKKYLMVNGVYSNMGCYGFYPYSSGWTYKNYNRGYSYYGCGRNYDMYLSYYEAIVPNMNSLNNYISKLKKGYDAITLEESYFNIIANHKYEVAFINGFCGKIKDIDTYSEKQIAFACKNSLAGKLPLMKYFQTYDIQFLNAFKTDDYPFSSEDYSDVITTCDILELHNISKYRYISFVKQFDKNSFDYKLFYDYVKMVDELDMNIKGKVVFKKDYKKAHDIVQKTLNLMSQPERIKKSNSKYCNEIKNLSWINRTEEYTIIIPQNVDQFLKEGNENNICVFSSKYYEKVYRHQSIIVFIRKNENIDKPYVCMELNYHNFDLIQIRGKANSRPNASVINYANKLILNLKKEAQKRMWC